MNKLVLPSSPYCHLPHKVSWCCPGLLPQAHLLITLNMRIGGENRCRSSTMEFPSIRCTCWCCPAASELEWRSWGPVGWLWAGHRLQQDSWDRGVSRKPGCAKIIISTVCGHHSLTLLKMVLAIYCHFSLNSHIQAISEGLLQYNNILTSPQHKDSKELENSKRIETILGTKWHMQHAASTTRSMSSLAAINGKHMTRCYVFNERTGFRAPPRHPD